MHYHYCHQSSCSLESSGKSTSGAGGLVKWLGALVRTKNKIIYIQTDLNIELMFVTSSLSSLLNAHYDRKESELGDFISTPDFRSSRALKSQNLKDFNFNSESNPETQDYLAQIKTIKKQQSFESNQNINQ